MTGKILRVNPETGAVKTVFQVPGIINDPHAQNGLLGFAFHPDFKNNPYIYISGTLKILRQQTRTLQIRQLLEDTPIINQQIPCKTQLIY